MEMHALIFNAVGTGFIADIAECNRGSKIISHMILSFHDNLLRFALLWRMSKHHSWTVPAKTTSHSPVSLSAAYQCCDSHLQNAGAQGEYIASDYTSLIPTITPQSRSPSYQLPPPSCCDGTSFGGPVSPLPASPSPPAPEQPSTTDLLSWASSLVNFAETAAAQRWSGWVANSTVPVCNWTGVSCRAGAGNALAIATLDFARSGLQGKNGCRQ